MFCERHHIRIEAAEQETAVGLEAGDFRQIMRALLVEAFRISRAVRVFYLQELAGVCEGPAVEGASEDDPAAALKAAEHGTAVAARVDECDQLPIAVARNEDRLAAHVSCEVVVLVGDLALVGEIDPSFPPKNVFFFSFIFYCCFLS